MHDVRTYMLYVHTYIRTYACMYSVTSDSVSKPNSLETRQNVWHREVFGLQRYYTYKPNVSVVWDHREVLFFDLQRVWFGEDTLYSTYAGNVLTDISLPSHLKARLVMAITNSF